MLKGISAAATGMLPQIKKQEAIANNLANAASAGFKRDRVFVEQLSKAQTTGVPKAADWQIPQRIGLAIDFGSGSMDRTGSPYDLAIAGDGFFVVETPSGEMFTRNGHFTVSPEGVLTTAEGHPVLAEKGEIRLPAGTLEVSPSGVVSVEGQTVDTLRIARFADTGTLVRTGPSLFAPGTIAVPPEEDKTSSIRQGFLESSNVNVIQEMVEMIATFRLFEADQRAIRAQDELLARVVNDLGRVPR